VRAGSDQVPIGVDHADCGSLSSAFCVVFPLRTPPQPLDLVLARGGLYAHRPLALPQSFKIVPYVLCFGFKQPTCGPWLPPRFPASTGVLRKKKDQVSAGEETQAYALKRLESYYRLPYRLSLGKFHQQRHRRMGSRLMGADERGRIPMCAHESHSGGESRRHPL
jgi:hypothetical protein